LTCFSPVPANMTPEELQAADEAFNNLRVRVATLETSLAALDKYKQVFDLLLSNNVFFTDLTKQLESRFIHVESQVAGLVALETVEEPIGRADLTYTLNSLRDNMLDNMRTMIEDHHPQTTTPAKPKHDAPALFSGKREDWKTFQAQLELFFLNTAPLYPTDVDKIMFSISRLGDTAAFKYMEKYIPSFKLSAEERPLLLSNLDTFFKAMSKTFGVTNAHVLAETHLRKLTQKGSALDYTNKFTNLAADTKWNDAAMISQYRLGLKESVQETISQTSHDEPETFAEFSQLAIDIDNRHYGYSLTRPSGRSTITRPQTTATPIHRTPAASFSSPPSMAMDLSQAQHKALDPQEKQRRKDNNLCTYCGSEGHWIKDCPTKPKFTPRPFAKNSQSVSAVQASPDVVFELGKDEA
jgi:hypothetical protein